MEQDFINKNLMEARDAAKSGTLAGLLKHQASLFPDRAAIIDGSQNITLTYRKLNEESDALAKSLIRIGLQKGDHVALILNNCWQNVVTKFAVAKAGAVAVNVNIHEKGDMLTLLLQRTDCSLFIVQQNIKKRAHMDMLYLKAPELLQESRDQVHCAMFPALRNIIVTDETKPQKCAWQFESLLEEGKALPDTELRNRELLSSPGDIVSMLHTSGSSGVPKTVGLSQHQLLLNAYWHIEHTKISGKDIVCMTAPLFHSLGIVGSLLTTMLAGGTCVLFDSLKDQGLLHILEKQHCTVFISVPTILYRLVSFIKENDLKPDIHMRLCISAGASCPVKAFEEAGRLLHIDQFMVMYGMTEAGPGISSTDIGDSLDIVSYTVGHFWKEIEWQVRNLATDEVLPRGTAGELCIKSPTLMHHYYKDQKETDKAIDPDGWLRTGDIVSVDENGLITLTGRCKDVIIRGGENISSKEVEDFLRTLPEIKDAAVVSAPDQEYGEKVFAFLILQPGKSMTIEKLRDESIGRIATIKIPEEIEILDAFPLTGSGKIAKGDLRKRANEIVKGAS